MDMSRPMVLAENLICGKRFDLKRRAIESKLMKSRKYVLIGKIVR